MSRPTQYVCSMFRRQNSLVKNWQLVGAPWQRGPPPMIQMALWLIWLCLMCVLFINVPSLQACVIQMLYTNVIGFVELFLLWFHHNCISDHKNGSSFFA